MIAVRAHIANSERSARCNLLLDAQAPGEHGGGGDVGLHVAWGNLRAGRRRSAGSDIQVGDGDVRDRFGGVEGRGLVKAIIERIEQAVIQAEAAADSGLAVAPHVPGKAHARLGQEMARLVVSAEVPMNGCVCRTPLTIA